jgi:hypothetical protein
MKLTPTEKDRAFAQQVYETFRSKPGSQQMASLTALTYFATILREHRPRVVVECGAGIGTLSHALLSSAHPPERLVLIEDYPNCIEQLRVNLGPAEGRYEVVSNPATLDVLGAKADLVIGDGGWMSPEEYRVVSEGTVVFVEGKRLEFRKRLPAALIPQGLSIEMTNYCAKYKLTLLTTRRFVVPIPRKIIRECAKKGCFVGWVARGRVS